MLKFFQYTFEELKITVADIGILIGYGEAEIPEPLPELIQKGLKGLAGYNEIRGGFRYFDSAEVFLENNTIRIDEVVFSPGKIVATQLKKLTSAALFICTAGKGISAHSKELTEAGELMEGYVLDVIGSVAAEKAMDIVESELKNDMLAHGLKLSDRFSPGYCDWSVAEQQKLFSLFPKDFCGVILSDSSLMNPIKSVSGIIGIGESMEQKGYQCNWCSDKNCIYGRIRRQKQKSS